MKKYVFHVCSIQVTQSKVRNSHFWQTWLLVPYSWMGISTPSSKSETWTWNVQLLLTLAVRKHFGMFLWQAIGVMSHCSSQDAILSIPCEHIVSTSDWYLLLRSLWYWHVALWQQDDRILTRARIRKWQSCATRQCPQAFGFSFFLVDGWWFLLLRCPTE